MDARNRTSVNFHPLPSGRFALSRTCAGPPEYSGRGGRQLYTHFLILADAALQAAGFQPFAIYRDAIALGHLLYQPDPHEVLEPVLLSQLHPSRDVRSSAAAFAERDAPTVRQLQKRLQSGRPLRVAHDGDRIALAERLIGQLPPETVPNISFSTSLVPSSDRPYVLTLVKENSKEDPKGGLHLRSTPARHTRR